MGGPFKSLAAILAVCTAVLFISSIFRPLELVSKPPSDRETGEKIHCEICGEDFGDRATYEKHLGPCILKDLQKHGFTDDVCCVSGNCCAHIGRCDLRGKPSGDEPIFELLGELSKPYLRTTVLEAYQDGTWQEGAGLESVDYGGETLTADGISQTETVRRFLERTGGEGVSTQAGQVQVRPLVSMGGFIPVVFNTTRLTGFERIRYFPAQHTFLAYRPFDHPYSVEYQSWDFEEELLGSAEPDAQPQYLQVPAGITERTKRLAREITEGLTNPHDKLVALAEYLRSNYAYDENFTPAPPDRDPVDWFLFEEKRGVCTHFNSAFVVMARSLGFPARAVGGFLVKPGVGYQLVSSKQYHLWAEVKFKDLGWVQFDATAPTASQQRRRTPTATRITEVQSTALKGQSVEVGGTVVDDKGNGVSGLLVLLYLKKNKNENTLSVGKGYVENGRFRIAIRIGENMDVGDYHVVAQTLGNSSYEGSWSDPVLRVMSESSLSLEAPSRVLVGRPFRVGGRLTDRISGTPLAQAEVLLRAGAELASRTTTDQNGAFQATLSLPREGNFTVTASFGGSSYYLGSSENRTVEAVPMSLRVLAGENLIRGEEVAIRGEVPVEGENIEISIENAVSGWVTSGAGGGFEFRCTVPASLALGPARISYRVPSVAYSTSRIASVYGRTDMEVSADRGSVRPGENLNVTVALKDDSGNPIPNAPVTCRGLQELTDNLGRATFQLAVPEDQRENFSFRVSFGGKDFYLPCQKEGTVPLMAAPSGPEGPLPLALVAGATGTGAGLAVAGLFFWRRKKKGKQEAKAPRPRTTVQILFPHIKEPLPDVWGVGEPLDIVVRVEGTGSDKVRVRVDGEEKDLKLTDGRGVFKKTFSEKGAHKIEAECGGAGAAREVRIVDYREEIIEVFKSLFNSFKERLGLNDDATPREFASAAAGKAGEVKGQLEELVRVFEIATYSPHSVGREDYEAEYLSQLAVREALEERLKEEGGGAEKAVKEGGEEETGEG